METKDTSVAILIHVDPQTRANIKSLAKNSGRSVTGTVKYFVEKVFGQDHKEFAANAASENH